MASPVFVALDTPDPERALDLVRQVRNHVGGVKIGLEFFCANGAAGVRAVAELGLPLFLDLKLHDIPNTVAKAVRALAPLEPALLTVHAAGGRAMMEDAKAAANASTRVIGVTVMTSLDASDLETTGIHGEPRDQVQRLTALAKVSGLDGVVCSGHEVAAARRDWNDGVFIVPGIRPPTGETADQKRVMSPADALAAGASILVIGRPITAAARPGAAARAIAATL